MILRALVALVLCAGAGMGVLRAQTPSVIRLEDAGPGVGPRMLAAALARPYDLVPPASNRFLFERGVTRGRTVIVLGRDAVVEGSLHGDLIVVGGDLYMHPGGRIDGRAVAYGGGVYESALASVQGGVIAYRDFTYDIEATPDAYLLRYRALNPTVTHAFELAGLYGVNIPSYDRTNGVSLPIGATIRPSDRFVLDPRVTYRSQLGRLDPSVGAAFHVNRLTTLRATAEYATYSNDTWIRSDLINSLHYLVLGNDTRNYYRGARAEVSLERAFETPTMTLTPYAGVQVQSGRSVRPLVGASGGPWAVKGRHDTDDVLRPNPNVDSTTVYSMLLGGATAWNSQGVAANARADFELGGWVPPMSGDTQGGTQQFGQLTFHGTIGFPTFGTQRLDFDAHVVKTWGTAPRQRDAYLGGPGSLPTLELLELGGDQLVFAEARYSVPLDAVQVPFVGPPTLSFREILGGAGRGWLPEIRQATGVRVAFGFLYGEFLVDPPHRHSRFGVGLSTGR